MEKGMEGENTWCGLGFRGAPCRLLRHSPSHALHDPVPVQTDPWLSSPLLRFFLGLLTYPLPGSMCFFFLVWQIWKSMRACWSRKLLRNIAWVHVIDEVRRRVATSIWENLIPALWNTAYKPWLRIGCFPSWGVESGSPDSPWPVHHSLSIFDITMVCPLYHHCWWHPNVAKP